jgi:hypothetical protein
MGRKLTIDIGMGTATFNVIDPNISDDDARALACIALGDQIKVCSARLERQARVEARKEAKKGVKKPNLWQKFMEENPDILTYKPTDVEMEWMEEFRNAGRVMREGAQRFWAEYENYKKKQAEAIDDNL